MKEVRTSPFEPRNGKLAKLKCGIIKQSEYFSCSIDATSDATPDGKFDGIAKARQT